jgi:hypothetical protein
MMFVSPFLDPLLSIYLCHFFRWFAIGRTEVGVVIGVTGKDHHWIEGHKESIIVDYELISLPL